MAKMNSYKCLECGHQGDNFEETETSCEDCGSHPAVRCPECREVHDLIYKSNLEEL